MRIVLQRVRRASVRFDGETAGEIGVGLLILVGAAAGDDEATARRLAKKCAEMRIFGNQEGRFAASLLDISGEALVVSQFTLLADTRKGRRPSFTGAAPSGVAEALIAAFVNELEALGLRVATGSFGAMMDVELVNDGPVTIVVDSAELDRPRRS
ncbi:MAG: D-aminoacyl-tRNA deacylase [Dehalococcoidia bacterium]